VKFFDIKKKFFSGSDKTDPCDDEDDSWLDKPTLDLEVAIPESSLKVSPFVQLSSQCLSTALSEEPCVSGGVSEAPPSVAEGIGIAQPDDDDFSMDL
jgi:hypothetical protein